MANWRIIVSGSGDADDAKLLELAEALKTGGQSISGANITIAGDDYPIVVGTNGDLSLPKKKED